MLTENPHPAESNITTDLLVIGGGIAGLTAAAKATTNGASVTVLEASSTLGGNGLFAGYIWTAPDRGVMAEWNPNGNEALRNSVVDRFEGAVDWVRSTGVEVAPAQKILAYGKGHGFDTNQYVDRCKAAILKQGAIHLNAETQRLLTDDVGNVTGAEVKLADGTVATFTAPSTMIATGGFQANGELLAERVHPSAGKMPLRSSPNSRGAGLRLAIAAGAATGGDNAGFYGHLIPSEVPFKDSGDFVGLSLYYSEHALLFNLNNERFTDESLADHLTTMELLNQPEGRGLLIADERVYQEHIIKPYVANAPSADKFALAMKRGGRAGVADDLDELADLPEEWGYDGAKIAEQIRLYNETISTGGEPTPGRKIQSAPLLEAPYYIIETIPAITYPFHGVLVDDQGRALNESGTHIGGLYVIGSDTGGFYNRAYAGGLATAITLSLAAAENATGQ